MIDQVDTGRVLHSRPRARVQCVWGATSPPSKQSINRQDKTRLQNSPALSLSLFSTPPTGQIGVGTKNLGSHGSPGLNEPRFPPPRLNRFPLLTSRAPGELVIDLWAESAPIAAKNFVKLCKIKYYNGCLFYNVQQNLLAQTGDPTATGVLPGINIEA